jgi:hypothetical protein
LTALLNLSANTSIKISAPHTRKNKQGTKMEKIKHQLIWIGLLICLMLSRTSFGAPNTSALSAAPYVVGQGWVTHLFDEAVQTRWFTFEEAAGHSYCLEAVQGPISPVALDPTITAYTSNAGTTVLTSMVSNALVQSTSAAGNPNRVKGARVCYIGPATGGTTAIRTFKVNAPISAGDAGFLRIRVVDTTLYLNRIKATQTNNWQSANAVYSSSCILYFNAENITTVPIRMRASFPASGAFFYGASATLDPSNSSQNANPVARSFQLSTVFYSTSPPVTQDPDTGSDVFNYLQLSGPFLLAHDGSPGMMQARAWQRISGLGDIDCSNSSPNNPNSQPNTTVEFVPFGKW